jgi:hypothetical protein
VIELTINENRLGSSDVSNQGFEKLTGADADKFTLAGNKLTFRSRGNMKSRYGYSDGFFNLKGEGAEQISNIHGGFDLNTISVITSGFKSLGYES